ncbi:fibronectin type III domain-containing protein [Polymorphospora lycopeni]|uniref:Fibronectin type III domain-containing protein n=1 Tax=Polymorphospora lycopeni TaxID=3140240 RepID=A0ABV5CQI5_9ACTN
MRRRIRAAMFAALATTGGLVVQATPAHAGPFCERPNPPPACDPGGPGLPPIGSLSTATRVPAGIQVTGWAEDADGGNVLVNISIGGRKVGSVTTAANGQFAGTVPAVAGANVCATAINNGAGHDAGIGCRTLNVAVDPVGILEPLERVGTSLTLRGWAVDGDTNAAVEVRVYHGDQLVGGKLANQQLPGTLADYPAYGTARGFSISVPERPTDGDHTVCVRAVNVGAGADKVLGCHTYSVRHNPFGALDEVTRVGDKVRVRGWSVDPDELTTPTQVDLYHDGTWVRSVIADGHRSDLDPRYGTARGFDIADLPATMVPGPHRICAYAINRSYGTVNTELGCRDYTLPAPVVAPTILPFGEWGIKATSISLGWRDNSTTEDGYRVERSVAGGPWTEIWRATVPATGTTDRDLTPGTRYCYRVIAFNVVSEAAAEVCATTLLPRLANPTGLTVTGRTDSTITISWQDNADNEAEYVVAWRPVGSTNPATTVVLAANPGTGQMTYTITGLSATTRYDFGVYPRRSGHELGSSADGTAWTTGRPKVDHFTSSATAVHACANTSVNLTWRVTGADRVVVRRGGTTLSDIPYGGVGTWEGSVGGGTHDGNVTYTLTAYAPDGRTYSTDLTVARTSNYPLLAALDFENVGYQTLEAWYKDINGNLLQRAATIAPRSRLLIPLSHCNLVRLEVIDPRTGYVAWRHPTGGIILGHHEGFIQTGKGA